MKTFMLWVSVLSGFVAAVLWFLATVVRVDYKPIVKNGMTEPSIVETEENSGREIDVLYTAKRQTVWNRWAALATSISMLAQAISLLL